MRPSHAWISRVNQKQKQLAELDLSAEQRRQLDGWIQTEFVYSTLDLEGVEVARDEIARLVPTASPDSASFKDEASALILSLRKVMALVEAEGKAVALT